MQWHCDTTKGSSSQRTTWVQHMSHTITYICDYIQSLQNRQVHQLRLAFFLFSGALDTLPEPWPWPQSHRTDFVLLDVTFVIGLPLPKAIWPQNLSMARSFILELFWDILGPFESLTDHRISQICSEICFLYRTFSMISRYQAAKEESNYCLIQ